MPLNQTNPGCQNPSSCPLSRVKAGMAVRIKGICASPDISQRLREIGFVEEQIIKLLLHQSTLICQVCNTRMAISARLAQFILVEPLSAEPGRIYAGHH